LGLVAALKAFGALMGFGALMAFGALMEVGALMAFAAGTGKAAGCAFAAFASGGFESLLTTVADAFTGSAAFALRDV